MDFLNINSSVPFWDFLIVVAVVGLAVAQTLTLRHHRIITNITAIYLAFVAVSAVPWRNAASAMIKIPTGVVTIRFSAFLIVFLLLVFLLTRSSLLQSASLVGPKWNQFLFAALEAGLLMMLVLTFFPPEALKGLSESVRTVFISDNGRLFWTIGPIVALLVLSDRR